MLRFFFDLLDIVQALQPIPALKPLLHFQNVAHELVILFCRPDPCFPSGLLDRAECLHHQNRVMGNNRTSAFANDCWMRDAFGIADIHDVPDHVVRVFLK